MAGKNGGARPGAGRKKGSKYLDLRAALEKKDPKAIDTFLEFLLANYMEDSKLMIWMGEHIFGKPTQEVDVSGDIEHHIFDEETKAKTDAILKGYIDLIAAGK
jgi:hypothetical protein